MHHTYVSLGYEVIQPVPRLHLREVYDVHMEQVAAALPAAPQVLDTCIMRVGLLFNLLWLFERYGYAPRSVIVVWRQTLRRFAI